MLTKKQEKELVKRSLFEPLYFVQTVFPWGEDGKLKDAIIEDWQVEYLNTLGYELAKRAKEPGKYPALRIAVGSGTDTGKTTMIAWIVIWFMYTRVMAKGIGTANTWAQLSNRTLSELNIWYNMCSVKHNFSLMEKWMTHVSRKEWRFDFTAWSKNNPDAFQGHHRENLMFIFDEASGIHQKIWEAVGGSLYNDKAMFLAFGNRTRTDGEFHECWNRNANEWLTMTVDTRSIKSPRVNKASINEIIDKFGLDHDYTRVRLLGLPPRGSTSQLIPGDIIKRNVSHIPQNKTGKLSIGVDLARFGKDETVIFARDGDDANIKFTRIKKAGNVDVVKFIINFILEVCKPGMDFELFIEDIINGGVLDILWDIAENIYTPNLSIIDIEEHKITELRNIGFAGYKIFGVNTGKAVNKVDKFTNYSNIKTALCFKMSEIMQLGISIPDDEEFHRQLKTYAFLISDKVKMAPKDHSDSPDISDTFMLTFCSELPRDLYDTRAQHHEPYFEAL